MAWRQNSEKGVKDDQCILAKAERDLDRQRTDRKHDYR